MQTKVQQVLTTGAEARWLVSLACLLAMMCFSPIFAPMAAAQTWMLAWSDEFNGPAGSAPSNADWNYASGNNNGWGNGELEVYFAPGNNTPPFNAAHPNNL